MSSTANALPVHQAVNVHRARGLVIKPSDSERIKAHEPQVRTALSKVRRELRARHIFKFLGVSQTCEMTINEKSLGFDLKGDLRSLGEFKSDFIKLANAMGIAADISKETHLPSLRQDVPCETIDLTIVAKLIRQPA